MMKHYWTVIVKKSHIDQESNNLVLGEAVEEIQFGLPDDVYGKFQEEIAGRGFAVVPIEHEVVSYLDSESPNSAAKISAEVELPTGKIIPLVNGAEITFGPNGRTRYRFRSNGLQVSGTGKNLFRVFDATEKQKRLLAEVPLFVNVRVIAPGLTRKKGGPPTR